MTPLLTAAEVAARLSVSRRQVQAWTATGAIQCVRLGARCVRYAEEHVESFVRSREVSGPRALRRAR